MWVFGLIKNLKINLINLRFSSEIKMEVAKPEEVVEAVEKVEVEHEL